MKRASYPRNCLVLFLFGAAPFFILCLLSPLVNISISTNLICISLVLVFALFKARGLEHREIKIRLASTLAITDTQGIVENCLNRLGYQLREQEDSLSKFATWMEIPFIPREIQARFEPETVLLSGPRYYLKHIQKSFKHFNC